MTDWKTIDSAPKDGTLILLFEPGNKSIPDDVGFVCAGIWDAENWYDGVSGYPEPTHWMPLPSPPKETADDHH